MKRCYKLGVMFAGLLALNAHAQEPLNESLTLWQALQLTLENHPDVRIANANIEEALANQTASLGAFDWKLSQQSQFRTSGFYTNWYIDQKATKQFAEGGIKLSTGYRIFDGIEPVYENIHATLGGGEVNAKLSVPLFQGRATDSRRTQVRNAELDIQLQQRDQDLLLNQLLYNAGLQYLLWYMAGQEVLVAENLLDLARQRIQAMESSFKSGELAEITVTEFQVTVFSREADLLEKQQDLKIAAVRLGLFIGDDAVQALQVPKQITGPDTSDRIARTLLDPARLAQHPKVVAVDTKLKQLQHNIALAKNTLLPQLDLDLVLANDIGSGSETLDGTESYVGVNFSVPIGQRKAKGKYSALQAKRKALLVEREKQLMILKNAITADLAVLRGFEQLRELRNKQVKTAQLLMEQEKLRFQAQAGDVFLLNTRERSLALARLSELKAYIEQRKTALSILARSAELLPMLDELQ